PLHCVQSNSVLHITHERSLDFLDGTPEKPQEHCFKARGIDPEVTVATRKSSVDQKSTRDERLVPGFDSRGIPPYHKHLKRRLLSALGM
ncbi:hypothetical protein RAF84_27630, partial [Klebsiella pneumoniae]